MTITGLKRGFLSRAGPARPRSCGFTLIEIIIASSIALVVFGAGYVAISSTVAASNESAARIHETENVRLFFNMLERDLSTAFPGPGNIQKKRQMVPPYLPTPSPMVMTETKGDTVPTSDILQFYCRSEHPLVRGDEYQFVRYYINRADNTVCRQATPCEPSAVGFSANLPDRADPASLTTAGDSDWAIFDNAFKLTAVFQRWNPSPLSRQYEKEGQSTPSGIVDSSTCDSLLVTFMFSDVFKIQRYNALHQGYDTSNVNDDPKNLKLSKNYRSYSKVFTIPACFKQ